MKIIKILLVIAVIQLHINHAHALNIFACEPEWASLAKEITGEKAKIFTATTAFQDAHYIQAKPSLIANMRKADMVICSGAGLESGWLPVLLQKVSNPVLQENGSASIMAAKYVKTLDIPAVIDRSEGDMHPEGNPHIHLNPYNIAKISDIFLEKIIAIDTVNADFYRKNHKNFNKKLTEKIPEWENKASGLKGKKIISQHKNFSYLFDWLEMQNIATLEPKPGVQPTFKHLANLTDTAKSKNTALIVHTPFEDKKHAKWLSDKSGIPFAELPFTIGGNKQSKNIFDLFDSTISILTENIGQTR